jgi:cell division control protein 6
MTQHLPEEAKSQNQSAFTKQELVLEMLTLLIDEFNCNHQADVNSVEKIEIYERQHERDFIKKFILQNVDNRKSGLLYLCGHPGTGKTSTLNLVLQEIKQDVPKTLLNPVEVFQHNAMTYHDVKTYEFQILKELHLRKGTTLEKLNRSELDEEDLSSLIARTLRANPNVHKILVIDEIDTF